MGAYSSAYSSAYDTGGGLSLVAIRDGFKARLDTVGSPLVAYDTTPVAITDDDVAIVEVGQGGIQPYGLGSLVEINIRVVVIVNRATIRDAEEALDAYVWPKGANSVIAAIKSDTTLGGIVDDTMWTGSAAPYGTPEGMPTGRQSEAQFRCIVNA